MADIDREDLDFIVVDLVKQAADMGLECLVIIEHPTDVEASKLTAPMGMSCDDRARILHSWYLAMNGGPDGG